jgi:hypothetical protein
MNKGEKEAYKNRKEKQVEDKIKLLDKLHQSLFPEEFDFMMDSIEDTRDRKRGKNPMNIEYQEKINSRRESLGVLPLKENGMPADNGSKEYIVKITKNLTSSEIQKKLTDA